MVPHALSVVPWSVLTWIMRVSIDQQEDKGCPSQPLTGAKVQKWDSFFCDPFELGSIRFKDKSGQTYKFKKEK